MRRLSPNQTPHNESQPIPATQLLSGWALRQIGALPMPDPRGDDSKHELSVRYHISLGQTSRILHETMRPLKPFPLHPNWCTLDPPGMKVKSCTDTDHNS